MSLVQGIRDLLLPPCCQVCRQRGEFPLCTVCRREFCLISPPICEKCGRPVQSVPSGICPACRSRQPHFSLARAPGVYAGALREAIRLLKFGGCRAMARPLGELMAELFLQAESPGAGIVVPVPLHVSRYRERGFNQSELLAREIARRTRLPLDERLLTRARATKAQSGLDAQGRSVNVQGAFSVRETLNGERILLVDDVMSTGFTVSECARALRHGGAGKVFVITAAMALPDAGRAAALRDALGGIPSRMKTGHVVGTGPCSVQPYTHICIPCGRL